MRPALPAVFAIVIVLTVQGCARNAPPPPTLPGPRSGPHVAPCPASPNCVSSQGTDAEHSVEPIHFGTEPAWAFAQLQQVIAAMPRAQIVRVSATHLRAEFTSAVFRFVDDVDCVLDAPARVIQIRSASRVGYWDLGVNRRRVEAIRAALTSRLRH